MLFSTLFSAFAIFTSAIAAPVSSDAEFESVAELVKRGPLETVYLSHCCWGSGTCYGPQAQYYEDTNYSQNGEIPQSRAWGHGNTTTPWVGEQATTFYDSGVVFSSGIASGAYGYSVNTYAGWGHNTYHAFKCFRDNGRLLYTESGDFRCFAQFYCMHATLFP